MVWGLCIALVAGIERRAVACAVSQIIFAIPILRAGRSIPALFIYLAAAASFYCYGSLDSAHYSADAQAFRQAVGGGTTIGLQGWISSFPRSQGGKSVFALRTTLRDREFDIGVSLQGFDAAYGDSLYLTGTVPATGIVTGGLDERRNRYMRSKAQAGFVRVNAREVRRVPGTAGSILVRSVFWPLHVSIRNAMVRALGERSGVPLALLLGDKSRMNARAERFIAKLGISHLFALSGLHLGLVLGIVLLLIEPLPGGKNLLLCAILGVYVGTVGDIVSLQRAYTMVVIGCAAKTLQRPIRPIPVLCRAFLLLLVIDPGSLYSVGFQFSFLATFAVLLCVGRMNLRPESSPGRRFLTYIRTSLTVSFYAQLFITPLALRYFGESSAITPVTTILFLPMVFALLLSSGACCIAAAASPDLGLLAYGWLGRGTDLFSALLGTIASTAPAPVRAEAPSLVLYYGGLALACGTRGGAAAKGLGWALMAASFYCNGFRFLP